MFINQYFNTFRTKNFYLCTVRNVLPHQNHNIIKGIIGNGFVIQTDKYDA